jgi:hypothetical protein
MGLFDKLIGGGLKGIADGAKSVIDSINAPKEERLKAQQAIEELKAKHESEALAASVEIEKAYLVDVGNSRDMQKAALAQSDVFSKRYVYYFSTFWSLFAAGYLTAITFIDVPEKNTRVVDTVLGFLLGTAIAAMFSWFYGSSMNSKNRNDQMYSAITDKLKHP